MQTGSNSSGQSERLFPMNNPLMNHQVHMNAENPCQAAFFEGSEQGRTILFLEGSRSGFDWSDKHRFIQQFSGLRGSELINLVSLVKKGLLYVQSLDLLELDDLISTQIRWLEVLIFLNKENREFGSILLLLRTEMWRLKVRSCINDSVNTILSGINLRVV